jgi:hypothetical protein
LDAHDEKLKGLRTPKERHLVSKNQRIQTSFDENFTIKLDIYFFTYNLMPKVIILEQHT